MNKNDLLNLLKRYNTEYREEAEHKDRTIKFIEENDTFMTKENPDGHIVASAWVVSPDRKKVLLNHHRKLNKWIHLGGHCDLGENVVEAAEREGREESGLTSIKLLSSEIFDIDTHLIPQHKNYKPHYHYSLTFLFEGDTSEKIVVSNESIDVKWVAFDEIEDYLVDTEACISRMAEKTMKKPQ